MAVSVFIRLGFAHKKKDGEVDNAQLHPSWNDLPSPRDITPPNLLTGSPLGAGDYTEVGRGGTTDHGDNCTDSSSGLSLDHQSSSVFQKRIGFLFDSTLTAFLMMGNLSPGLKSHAVTMFEVGKLADESLDSFLNELSKVGSQAEGEAKRYFEHAVTLRDTVQFLRRNQSLFEEEDNGIGIDLLRCESLYNLDDATATRILQRNYCVLVSMAPLSQEIRSVSSCCPPHVGPPIPEVNSVWFKLWLYSRLRCGPPSILLTKGTRVRKYPPLLKGYNKVLLTSWGHDGAIVSTSNLLITLNDALTHSAVLVQAHGWQSDGEIQHISYPFDQPSSDEDILNHPCLLTLGTEVDLKHMCGFITMLRLGVPPSRMRPNRLRSKKPPIVTMDAKMSSEVKAQKEEIDEFLHDLKELGIGGTESEPQTPTGVTTSTDGLENGNGIRSSSSELDSHSKVLLEWVPLEMSIGIPLFSGDINKTVCKKISDYRLFYEDSLEKQTHTSRLLALDVMNFIAEYNVSSSESEPVDNHQIVPLPTRNLLFDGQSLRNFDIR